MTFKSATKIGSWKAMILKVCFVISAAGLMAVGCHEGREGDRCNPDLPPNSDECTGAGLTCQTPSTCVESYCCPTPASSSTNGYCNGQLCPAPAADAGS